MTEESFNNLKPGDVITCRGARGLINWMIVKVNHPGHYRIQGPNNEAYLSNAFLAHFWELGIELRSDDLERRLDPVL